MAKKPFDNSAANTASYSAPADLGLKLILFSGIKANAPLAGLNNKLLLTSEDEKGSDYVFGYVLNNSLPQRLRSFLKQSGVPNVPEAQQFKQIFDGAADGFEAVYEDECITFLVRNGKKLETSNEFVFGTFKAYTCETPEEAAETLRLLEGRETIAISSLFMIERAQLVEAIEKGKAQIREADPEIVFNRSGFMRTLLAFPEKFTP